MFSVKLSIIIQKNNQLLIKEKINLSLKNEIKFDNVFLNMIIMKSMF